MSERRFFIFGAGYSGKAFARANGQRAPLFGTTRAPERFEALRS
ncbi:NAD(P)-dependent oxidoreductase, partial [Mesorhizobium sp. M1C.F.Ca.ET.193.01.1.1]